jgi:hypothetical protein
LKRRLTPSCNERALGVIAQAAALASVERHCGIWWHHQFKS